MALQGEAKDKLNKTMTEFTTETLAHPDSFNPKWQQLLDNDSTLESDIDKKIATVKSETDKAVKSLEDGKVDNDGNEGIKTKYFDLGAYKGKAGILNLSRSDGNKGFGMRGKEFENTLQIFNSSGSGEIEFNGNGKKILKLAKESNISFNPTLTQTTSTEAFSVKDATGNEVFGVDTVNGVCNAKMLKLNNRIIKLSSSVMNGAGAGIFALQNEKPQFGKLFAFNKTAPSKFCVYNLYKASADSLPVATLIKNNELEIKAMNGGGTICLNDSSANVEMYCEITIF